MKKLLALLLAVMMVLGLVACSNGQEEEEVTTVTVADVLEDINDENLESIALYYNTGSGSTSAAALPADGRPGHPRLAGRPEQPDAGGPGVPLRYPQILDGKLKFGMGPKGFPSFARPATRGCCAASLARCPSQI